MLWWAEPQKASLEAKVEPWSLTEADDRLRSRLQQREDLAHANMNKVAVVAIGCCRLCTSALQSNGVIGVKYVCLSDGVMDK